MLPASCFNSIVGNFSDELEITRISIFLKSKKHLPLAAVRNHLPDKGTKKPSFKWILIFRNSVMFFIHECIYQILVL